MWELGVKSRFCKTRRTLNLSHLSSLQGSLFWQHGIFNLSFSSYHSYNVTEISETSPCVLSLSLPFLCVCVSEKTERQREKTRFMLA